MHPFSKSHQICVVVPKETTVQVYFKYFDLMGCYYISFQDMQSFFLVSCLSNKLLSYKWAASILRQFSMILSPNKSRRKIFFLSCPRHCERGLIILIVYYFQIWNKKRTLLWGELWAVTRVSIIWKSDLTDKMKRSFFQAAVVSILLYGCTIWTLTKRLKKKLDGNYTRMLRAILNKSWRQHPTRHQLYGHLPPITKTIKVRRTRHAGHCWRSKDELISDVLLWTPEYGQAKAGRPARTCIQQLCEDTGCNPEDLPEAMNDREKWRVARISVLAARHDDDDDDING